MSFVALDGGRLRVNPEFVDVLASHGLATFTALWSSSTGETVRQVKQRTTTRLTLDDAGTPRTLYLKRHGPVSPWEWLKSVLRLNWPVHGARPEFEAILAFQEAGLPTVTPVAFGEYAGQSLLLTESLEEYVSLRESLRNGAKPFWRSTSSLARELGRLTRRMHAAGLCHQDFYFDHLLVPRDDAAGGLRVIDLGRVRTPSFAGFRWKLKDLAQLNYSARDWPWTLKLRFLCEYLGRPLRPIDWLWLAAVCVKSHSIARHTRRHRL